MKHGVAPLIASPEVQERLRLFAGKIEGVCRECDFSIYASQDATEHVSIEDLLDKRPRRKRSDFPAVASFTGVDRRGIYRMQFGRRRAGLEFEKDYDAQENCES